MEYTLDIYSKQPEQLMQRMAQNCKARRLEPCPGLRHHLFAGRIQRTAFDVALL